MGIDELAADPGFQFDHAAGLVALHDDVVQGATDRDRAAGRHQPGFQEIPGVRFVASLKDRVEALNHVVGRHIGQESKAAAIDAKQRDIAPDGELRREQHRSVTANCDDQVRISGKLVDRPAFDILGQVAHRNAVVDQHHESARPQMTCECRHRIGHAGVLDLANQCDPGEAFVHLVLRPFSTLERARARQPPRGRICSLTLGKADC
jgi:hypothetical protein